MRSHPVVIVVLIVLAVGAIAIGIGLAAGDDTNDTAAVVEASADDFAPRSLSLGASGGTVSFTIGNDGKVPLRVKLGSTTCASTIKPPPGTPYNVMEPGRGLQVTFAIDRDCKEADVRYEVILESVVAGRVRFFKPQLSDATIECVDTTPALRCELVEGVVVVAAKS
ncbi:MAG TPA: hypothetical protein VIH82_09195 [Acidimicrobiia bacterium]|jgi:hypothetical protein